MPRPSKCRVVSTIPDAVDFKPRGIPMRDLQEVYLPVDGFEAVRLTDLAGLEQGEAARRMGISRQTFGRILASARRTIARALVHGMALRILGGHYEVRPTGGDSAVGRTKNSSEPEETNP